MRQTVVGSHSVTHDAKGRRPEIPHQLSNNIIRF